MLTFSCVVALLICFFRLVQAAFNACSKKFGALNGILSNHNDCIDLVTSTIAAKRVSGAGYPQNTGSEAVGEELQGRGSPTGKTS